MQQYKNDNTQALRQLNDQAKSTEASDFRLPSRWMLQSSSQPLELGSSPNNEERQAPQSADSPLPKFPLESYVLAQEPTKNAEPPQFKMYPDPVVPAKENNPQKLPPVNNEPAKNKEPNNDQALPIAKKMPALNNNEADKDRSKMPTIPATPLGLRESLPPSLVPLPTALPNQAAYNQVIEQLNTSLSSSPTPELQAQAVAQARMQLGRLLNGALIDIVHQSANNAVLTELLWIETSQGQFAQTPAEIAQQVEYVRRAITQVSNQEINAQ